MATIENTDTELFRQVECWNLAKKDEKQATKNRIEIEKKILARLEEIGEVLPDEGDRTYSNGTLKITLGSKLNRKITDEKRLLELASDIPEDLQPWKVVETVKLDTKGMRWIVENEPGMARLLSEVIEEKPAKVSVKISEVD